MKQILIDNGNTLRSEKMIIEYLQSIDDVCKEVGSIGTLIELSKTNTLMCPNRLVSQPFLKFSKPMILMVYQ